MAQSLQAAEPTRPPISFAQGQRALTLPPPPPLTRQLRSTKWLGAAILALFFVVGGGWAATAPLSGAAIAPGVVSPQSSRQTVQHLEGGIIREILVKEGEIVTAGQVLAVLEDVSPRSEVETQRSRLRTLAAMEARLEAERRGLPKIEFTHPVLQARDDPEVEGVIRQQINQFETRRSNDAGREGILTQRIAQLQQQIVGAERQLVGIRRQTELIREEIVGVKELFEKGYEKKPRLLALQRAEAELVGTEGELLSRVARSQEAIGETRLQIMNIREQRREDIDKELAETKAKRAEVEELIKQSLDKLSRTTIVAPVDGTILDIRFKTTGGVVRPGEPILDLVPSDDDLIIDARVSPNDIDEVRADQEAYVIFPSYSQRNLFKVAGKVDVISPDALRDEKTGQSYYVAKIRVDRDQLREVAPEIQLTPGMPAETFITTKGRTVLEYLIQPYLLIVEHAFREH